MLIKLSLYWEIWSWNYRSERTTEANERPWMISFLRQYKGNQLTEYEQWEKITMLPKMPLGKGTD